MFAYHFDLEPCKILMSIPIPNFIFLPLWQPSIFSPSKKNKIKDRADFFSDSKIKLGTFPSMVKECSTTNNGSTFVVSLNKTWI